MNASVQFCGYNVSRPYSVNFHSPFSILHTLNVNDVRSKVLAYSRSFGKWCACSVHYRISLLIIIACTWRIMICQEMSVCLFNRFLYIFKDYLSNICLFNDYHITKCEPIWIFSSLLPCFRPHLQHFFGI